MASPRSRLVTWSYTLTSELPWKTVLASAPGPGPCGDPRSPPRRGSPPLRGLVSPARGGFGVAPQTICPGAEPPDPHVRRLRWKGSWFRGEPPNSQGRRGAGGGLWRGAEPGTPRFGGARGEACGAGRPPGAPGSAGAEEGFGVGAEAPGL